MEATPAECLQSYPFLKSPESPAVIVWPNLTVPSGYFTDGGILAGDTLLLPMEFYCFPVSAFHCSTHVKNMETTPAECLQSYPFLRSPDAPAVIVWPNLSAPSDYFADGSFPVSAFHCCTRVKNMEATLAECLQSYPFLKSPEAPAVIVWPNLSAPLEYFVYGGILTVDTFLLYLWKFYCFPVSAFHCCTRVKNMEPTPAECLPSYPFLKSPEAPAVIVWPNLSAPLEYFVYGGILTVDTFLLYL
ncbi:hypothetical protein MRX96_003894 [Rhipicephalus microplus]